jgi:type I restriction enzyme S subunit
MPPTVESGIPYLMTGDFCGINELDFSNAKLISEDDYIQLSKKMKPEKEDIVFARYASVGAVRYIDFTRDFLISYSCAIIKSGKKITPKYLYHYLTSGDAQKQIQLEINTGSQANIGIDSMKNSITIAMPCVDEQRLISDFLTTLDNLITLHQRKYDKLVNVKKSCLEKMFPKNGSNVPEIRFAGFTEAWEQRKVGELASDTYGGGTPATSKDEFWHGNIPWIQSSDLTEHQVFGVVPRKHITKSAVMNSAAKIVPENSLAIITRVGVGKLAIMPFSYTTSQDFLSLSGLKTDVEFTAYLIYRKLQGELNSVQGTSIKGITKDELLAKEVLVPERKEQEAIGSFFRQLDNLITLHQRELEKLQNLKKACLEKMFV